MRLLWMTVSALVAATIIVVCFVLPAEFRLDPTGLGRATGLIKLAGPKTVTAPPVSSQTSTSQALYYSGGYRSDFVDIPLTVAGSASRGEELEYKVHMKPGATLAYSWTVEGIQNPEEFYFDFHGESKSREPGAEPTVIEYRQTTGTESHGTLVAPFEGIFGWYLQNQSEQPVVVHLKISGFYDLVPPGEYGNEAGIEANKVAQVR